MSEHLKNRIIKLLENGLRNPSNVNQSDFDELKILNARSRAFFPLEFNSLMDETSYSGSSSSTMRSFERLLRILEVIDSLPEELRVEPNKTTAGSTSLIPMFELGKADKTRIFELCSDMRKIVFASQDFDEPHRLRLLNRIAHIEAETHKPKGMFDSVLGGISDIGETLGKFGKNIKPLTDRMAEVAKIARKGTKEYDQLPAPEEIKRLPAPSAEESADS